MSLMSNYPFFLGSLSSALENTINTLIVMRPGAKFVLRMSPQSTSLFFHSKHILLSSVLVQAQGCPLSFSCSVFVFRSSMTGAWHLAEGVCLITAFGLSPSVIVQTGPSRSACAERKQATHKVTFQTKSNKCFIDKKRKEIKQGIYATH